MMTAKLRWIIVHKGYWGKYSLTMLNIGVKQQEAIY